VGCHKKHKKKQMSLTRIEQEKDLIELLKTFNNSSEVRRQIEYAEERIHDLEEFLKRRRERKSFVRRIEKEVGQEKLYHYFMSNGIGYLYPYFKEKTLQEFKESDPIDWIPLSEPDLRQLIHLQH
jgi:hypothetical protein